MVDAVLPPHANALSRAGVWPALLAVALAFGIAGLAGWAARDSLARMNALTDARAHARTTRLHLEQVLSLFKDVETGSRGYVLSGRVDFLAPYHAARAEIPARYAALKTRIESPPAGVDWAELDVLVGRRLALAAGIVNLRESIGEAARGHPGLLDEGKQAMDQVRAAFARLDAAEDARIARLAAEVLDLRAHADRLSWISMAVSLTLVALGGALLLRGWNRRRRLERDLLVLNHELEARVGERTAELADANARLRDFAAGETRAVEAERRRLAREVHDQIGQVFTAIKLIIGGPPMEGLAADRRDALKHALEAGVATTRRVTAALRPPLLDDLGLEAALRHFAEHATRGVEVAAEVEARDADVLNDEQALGVFRIVQEAVSNALHHARARNIRIRGVRAQGVYMLSIADDGRGLPDGPTRPGALGLVGMRERAALLGGECGIESAPGAGTTISVRLPIDKKGSRDEAAVD